MKDSSGTDSWGDGLPTGIESSCGVTKFYGEFIYSLSIISEPPTAEPLGVGTGVRQFGRPPVV